MATAGPLSRDRESSRRGDEAADQEARSWRLYAASFGLCLLLLAAVLRLHEADLRVPLHYIGDPIVFLVKAKGLAEGQWVYGNDRLGAPFGANFRDFPMNLTLDSAAIWVLSWFTQEPGLLVNLFWIGAVCLTAAAATYCLRRFGVAPPAAVAVGVMYALQPYVFYRGISHLHSVFYVVPLVATAAIELAAGRWGRSVPVYAWLGCALAGLTYTYTAFFSCFTLGCAGLLAWIARRERRAVGVAAVLIAIVAAGALIDLSPSLLQRARSGPNLSMEFKKASEADLYGLKVRHLVTPVRDHPVPLLREFEKQLREAMFPGETENESAKLGLAGTAGLAALAGVSLAATVRGGAPGVLGVCSALLWMSVLLASVGGLGGIFNVLVAADIRCYNRIVPFIGFYCLLAVALGMSAGVSRLRRRGYRAPLVWGLLLCAAAAAAFDQGSRRGYWPHEERQRVFRQDREFVRRVEAGLPAGAKVFQLPHLGYPIEELRERIYNNDRGRAYVHSEKYRWSFGGVNGTLPDQWGARAEARGPAELLHVLHHAGFSGLWVDLYGYPAQGSPQAVLTQIAGEPVRSADGRFLFYDLRGYGSKVAAQEKGAPDLKAHPVEAYFERGFFPEERSATSSWHWSKPKARMALVNPLPVARTVNVSMVLEVRYAEPQALSVSSGGATDRLKMQGRRPYSRQVTVPAGGTTTIDFDCDCSRIETPDVRGLYFAVLDLRMSE